MTRLRVRPLTKRIGQAIPEMGIRLTNLFSYECVQLGLNYDFGSFAVFA